MRTFGRWLVVALAALFGLVRRRKKEPEGEGERIIAPGSPDRPAESVVIVLLFAAALAGLGFVVLYALDSLGNRTQLFGIALALCFALIAAALVILGKRVLVSEDLEEDYPQIEHPAEQESVAQMLSEGAGGMTRKRLLLGAGGAAGGALGLAGLTPLLSLGPWVQTDSLYETPWQARRRLVDETGRPLRALDISRDTFYTAFPEDARHDLIGAPLVLVRLDPSVLRLPADRAQWAPGGILAYSKICTHAGCAIALYRTPLFDPTAPGPALVCPCHYSTFDPAAGGTVTFGPAGRPLPQLPLTIDAQGHLRAAGNFSGPVGPAWQGVRAQRPS